MISVLVLLLIGLVYSSWISLHPIVGGDWPYYFPEQLAEFSLFQLWSNQWPYGFGGNQVVIASLKLYLHAPIVVLVNMLGIPWVLIEKIFWFWGFIALAGYSSFRLTKSWIGVLVYLTNTWILMIVGGGQMGVAMAIAVAPLVLERWIAVSTTATEKSYKGLFHRKHHNVLLTFVISVSLLVLFDIRVAYVVASICGLYVIWSLRYAKTIARFIGNTVVVGLISGIGILILHAFWLVPIILSGTGTSAGELGAAYTGSEALSFFSVARFPQAFALLHPNWPENLFGKVYHMRPEFLLVPLMAFAGLLFTQVKLKTQSKNSATQLFDHWALLFFACIGLVGAFLAKGVNEPFGFVYRWAFEYVPGFVLFRDPTKWYLLIALSYSVLIPQSVSSISVWLTTQARFKKINAHSRTIVSIVFLVIWVVLIREAIVGTLGGTFITRSIPTEYSQLTTYIESQDDFSRTLWIPQRSRFGYFSNKHPALDALQVTGTTDVAEAISWLAQEESYGQLTRWGVRTVIVPHDSDGEIFQQERAYCAICRDELVPSVSAIPYLNRVEAFTDSAVFTTGIDPRKIWIEGSDEMIKYQVVSPSQVQLTLLNTAENAQLVFSEAYDPGWQLMGNGIVRSAERTEDNLNQFIVPAGTNGDFELYYVPQRYAQVGALISIAGLVCVILFVGFSRLKKK